MGQLLDLYPLLCRFVWNIAELVPSILYTEVFICSAFFNSVALKKPVAENVIASLLHGSLLALEYLHTKVGLIHRDIKAGNLLLTLDGKLKLGIHSLDPF